MSIFTKENAQIAGINGLKWAFSQAILVVATDVIVEVACYALGLKGLESEGIVKKENKYYKVTKDVNGKTQKWTEVLYVERFAKLENFDDIRDIIKTITSISLMFILPDFMREKQLFISPITFTWKRFVGLAFVAGFINHHYQPILMAVRNSACVTSLRKYKVVNAYLLPSLSYIPRALFLGALYTSGMNHLNGVAKLVVPGIINLMTADSVSDYDLYNTPSSIRDTKPQLESSDLSPISSSSQVPENPSEIS